MKRHNNLYGLVCTMENLILADHKASEDKGSRPDVQQHMAVQEKHLKQLQSWLLNKTYRTSRYYTFTVYEPKERIIFALPYFPDRIVHHAIMNVLEPIWMSQFTHNTFSCIKTRGIDGMFGCRQAVYRGIQSFHGRNLYALKIDLKKFYPSIPHDVMKQLIRKKIKDKDLLALLDEIIDSCEGLPIGNYLSQFLSNLVLCYFMHYVNEQLAHDVKRELGLKEKPIIKAYEYADDITFLSDSKEVLHCTMHLIRQYLEGLLHLKVKENYQVFPIAQNKYDNTGRTLDFVGFQFCRNQTLLRKKIKKNFCKKCAAMRGAQLSHKDYCQEIASWLGWLASSNAFHLIRQVVAPEHVDYIIAKVKAIQAKRKKRLEKYHEACREREKMRKIQAATAAVKPVEEELVVATAGTMSDKEKMVEDCNNILDLVFSKAPFPFPIPF